MARGCQFPLWGHLFKDKPHWSKMKFCGKPIDRTVYGDFCSDCSDIVYAARAEEKRRRDKLKVTTNVEPIQIEVD